MNIYDTAINVTFTGIVLVFGMLVLLVLILMIFGLVSVSLSKRAKKKATKMILEQAANEEPEVVPVTSAPKEQEGMSEEIVAVISAAVASMYAGSSKKPVIKSIKPVGGRSAWASAGVYDNTRAF